MKVMLIRSPRLYWPFINEFDNFLLPQSLPCLAAALLRAGHEPVVVDCMPIRMGWRSLGRRIAEERPQMVGVGDSESLYSHDAARVLAMAKQIDPGIITVAGGAHFSNLAPESLEGLELDYIVRGEGELSLVNLVDELERPAPDPRRVRGIAFLEGGELVVTEPQPLAADLDSLPMPAYHLMPMDAYGRSRFIFSPGGITIHHSRGCRHNCEFCVWWVQMGERSVDAAGNETVRPCWRTKSVEYAIEEVELLRYRYGKRCLIFVDDTWNTDPEWSDGFAEAVLGRGLDIHWFAFMRADYIVRDHRLGIMDKLVRSGLYHTCIGIERPDDGGLGDLGKQSQAVETSRECLSLLKERYPQVFRQVTFIVGVRSETPESLERTLRFAVELDADYPGFHPLTPIPGTALWERARAEGWLELDDFAYFDWSTPVMGSEKMTRDEIDEALIRINKRFVRPLWLLRGLFNRHRYKRRMYMWFFMVMMRLVWSAIKRRLNPFTHQYLSMIKPRWHDD